MEIRRNRWINGATKEDSLETQQYSRLSGPYAGGNWPGKNGPESLEAFFSLIERVAKLTGGGKGKSMMRALDGLKKVIKELGLNGSETVARNKAKGAENHCAYSK